MSSALYPCDLHTHTLRSDGNDTCQELIDHAAAAGIRVLAITDHDIIAPETILVNGRELAITDYAAQKGLLVLRGIEFSCDTLVEDVHIIGLGCDFSNSFFAREHRASIESKIHGYRLLCQRLSEDGMPLDWNRDILGNGKVEETAVQRKMIFEAMAAKGYQQDWSSAKLLVKNTPRYAIKRPKPDPISIIKGIKAAGGIAILAHPWLIDETPVTENGITTREIYIDSLISAGLHGIEGAYPYDKTSYGGRDTPAEIEQKVRARYERRLPVISGGSDYHNEGKKGSRNPRMLGEKGVSLAYFLANPLLGKLAEGFFREGA